jgi:hypothetical protein
MKSLLQVFIKSIKNYYSIKYFDIKKKKYKPRKNKLFAEIILLIYKIFFKSETNKLSLYYFYSYKIILENKNKNPICPKTIYYLILYKYTNKKLKYIQEEIIKYCCELVNVDGTKPIPAR